MLGCGSNFDFRFGVSVAEPDATIDIDKLTWGFDRAGYFASQLSDVLTQGCGI